METYRPLPDSLEIKEAEWLSKITGNKEHGLFATKDIPKGTNLGRSHIKLYTEIIRTPLGAFYNHSNMPNAVKKPVGPNKWNLVTKRDIKAGEEILVSYTFYQVENE